MTMDAKQRARVSELLDAYGSDIQRWPADDRARVAQLSDSEWSTLAQSTQRDDRLLLVARDAADNQPASDALMARIMATLPTSHATDQSSDDQSNVIPLARRSLPPGKRSTSKPASHSNTQSSWQSERFAAAALLAASLVLGLYIGSNAQFRTTAETIGQFAGITSAPQGPLTLTALDEAMVSIDDEDLL